MEFTYASYKQLIHLINEKGYTIANYSNYDTLEKCVILRHDVDNSLTKAVQLSELERKIGVSSTYFVLITSEFYNIFSRIGEESLRKLTDAGHEIGLHFDEKRYPDIVGNLEMVRQKIIEEGRLLSLAVGKQVKCVSMHRPSRQILESDLKIEGMINSYGKVFFEEFKYLSDSRRRWREPVEDIIRSGKGQRLHILTHPFWYNEEELTIGQSVRKFLNSTYNERYKALDENITDLESILNNEN